MGQMMDEVGYTAETLAQQHREREGASRPSTVEHSLMQSSKQLKLGADRRRDSDQAGDSGTMPGEGNTPASSSTVPSRPTTVNDIPEGKRNTRGDPIHREEHLTDEGWAIMTAVEHCVNRVVWKLLKSLNLKQREKLLASICLTFQEMVEGDVERSTVGKPESEAQTTHEPSLPCRTNGIIFSDT